VLKLNSILAPVDFSDRSTLMAQHAAHMAAHFGAQLILAHVDEVPDPYYRSLVAPAQGEMDEQCRRVLAKIANRISIGHPIETLLLRGDPAHKLEEVVEERGIELVMMATRGHGSFRRFVMGSVTAKILHDVMCPVFTGVHVPQVAKFTGDPYVRVACAVDLREQSETVLAWAADFAASWKADLILIHAAPLVSSDEIYGSFFPADAGEKLLACAREKVEYLRQRVGCKAEVHVGAADTVPYVRQVAQETYADVLIIGRSVNGVLRGRLRTHAYALIRESPCPVISV
jgi:nucleotide-binding universal stress UspA family protein